MSEDFQKHHTEFLIFFQGRLLHQDSDRKIFFGNQTLVMQGVGREASGVYTCTAHNAEGDGESNALTLDVRCKSTRQNYILHVVFKTGPFQLLHGTSLLPILCVVTYRSRN